MIHQSSTLVFFVSGKSPKTMPGGLGAYAYNTSRILQELGYDVRVIGFSDLDEDTALGPLPVVHFRSPFGRLAGLGAFLMVPRFVAILQQIVRERRPERVIVYGAGIWGAVGVALKHALRGDVPVDAIVAYFTTQQHEYDGHVRGAPLADYGLKSSAMVRALNLLVRVYITPRERRMLQASDAVIVHYRSTERLLLDEVAGLDPRRIHRIPYYVDLYDRDSEAIFRGRAQAGVPHVVVLCRQDPRKGINTFLKAVRILRDRGARFACTVAGTGVFLEPNRALAARLGLGDFVRFPGFVPSVEAVLDDTDIYVLPSVEEGSGAISVLEAMRKGIAIVTTRCDGIPEDFIDGETGVLVPLGDPMAMADAVQRLLDEPETRARMAERVHADYRRRFSVAKMRDGLSEVLETL